MKYTGIVDNMELIYSNDSYWFICESTGQTRYSCLLIFTKSCFEIINHNVASHSMNSKVVKSKLYKH